MDQLQELALQKRALVAELEPKPEEGEKEKEEAKEEPEDTPMPDIPEVNGKHSESEEDEAEAPPRNLRRGQERVNDRKRKREEEAARKEKERKEKAAANKLSKQEIKLKKIQDQMDTKKEEIKDCEEQIADLNNDLRETDCQRTKCLGRDRFCNRYYWFERNGMPFGGVPDTSTAHYGYANGRLWVQGPDPMELSGFMELPKEDEIHYKGLYGTTPADRKITEEGETHLPDALHWGYIDDADAIDGLIAWLDERGLRERALRKELQSWRDVIVECMQKMRAHIDEDAARRAESEAEHAPPTMRISTRTKTYVDLDHTKWRCLAWSNTLALRDLGTKHVDSAPAKRGRRAVADKEAAKAKEKIVLDKKGKAVGKRGGR
jgi:WSTF/HB1/Itc1p/MBD9 motif protein